MFFGVVVRGWWALPVGAVLLVAWVLYQVFRLALILGALALQVLMPVAGAGLSRLLGRLDARYVDRLETAAERHENGIERRQEMAARSALRLAR